MRRPAHRIGNTHSALDRAIEDIRSQLDGRTPDLAFLFVSSNHGAGGVSGTFRLQHDLGVRHLIGCTAEAVIGTGVEVESGSALSLWCAAWRASCSARSTSPVNGRPTGSWRAAFRPEDLDFVPRLFPLSSGGPVLLSAGQHHRAGGDRLSGGFR